MIPAVEMILSEQCPCIAVSPLRSPEEELEEPEEVEKEAGLVGDKKVEEDGGVPSNDGEEGGKAPRRVRVQQAVLGLPWTASRVESHVGVEEAEQPLHQGVVLLLQDVQQALLQALVGGERQDLLQPAVEHFVHSRHRSLDYHHVAASAVDRLPENRDSADELNQQAIKDGTNLEDKLESLSPLLDSTLASLVVKATHLSTMRTSRPTRPRSQELALVAPPPNPEEEDECGTLERKEEKRTSLIRE